MKRIIDFELQKYEEKRERNMKIERKKTITDLFSDLRAINPQAPFFYYKRIKEESSGFLKSLSFDHYGTKLENYCIPYNLTNPVYYINLNVSEDMKNILLTIQELDAFRAITNDLDYAQSDPSLRWQVHNDLFKLVGRILS